MSEDHDRIIVLEKEVETMKEKMDALLIGQERVIATVASLNDWKVYLMGGSAVCGAVVMFLLNNWGTVAKLLLPG
jgi:hypothetical protein